jgi:hypothetical protein
VISNESSPNTTSLIGRPEKAGTHVFEEIGQESLIAVFETWINRLKWVMEHEEV